MVMLEKNFAMLEGRLRREDEMCLDEESHDENVLNLYYNAHRPDCRKLAKLQSLPRRLKTGTVSYHQVNGTLAK